MYESKLHKTAATKMVKSSSRIRRWRV